MLNKISFGVIAFVLCSFILAFGVSTLAGAQGVSPPHPGPIPVFAPLTPYAGQWYNPETAGQGFFLEVSDAGTEFAYYTYGVDGTQAWFVSNVADVRQASLGQFDLYRPAGGHFLQPGGVEIGHAVGSLYFKPTSCTTATVEITVADPYVGCTDFSPPNPACHQTFTVNRLTTVGQCPSE